MASSFLKSRAAYSGFSIIELMITLLVIAVLLIIAIPSFNGYLDRGRLKSAGEGIFSDLQYARTEAILHGPTGKMNVSFFVEEDETDPWCDGLTTEDSCWCYGLTTEDSCDCTLTDPNDINACAITSTGALGTEKVLKRTSSHTFLGNITMAPPAQPTIGFTSLRGLSSQSQIELSADGNTVRIIVSPLGQIRICSPTATILGYSTC